MACAKGRKSVAGMYNRGVSYLECWHWSCLAGLQDVDRGVTVRVWGQ